VEFVAFNSNRGTSLSETLIPFGYLLGSTSDSTPKVFYLFRYSS